ncbi:MAG: CARDB domain-containing protein [Candidatus Poseidoniaceae archaeon]|nr:CARDB domain-containing protein [Candidatus Poseidoniaceae archaeon]
MASAWKPILAILLLCIASVPMPASAEQSGSIQASPSTVALQPANPVAGGSVTINLQLYNSGNYATDVEYSFYRDFISSDQLIKKATVDIDTDTSAPVSAVWNGLTEGDHEVHITFEHPRGSGTVAEFYIDFTVTGLPNLKVTQTELTPSTGIFSGDTVILSSLVRNVGSEPAVASTLHIDLPGAGDLDLATPPLAAGATEWVNTTFTAPESGSHTLYLTPDYQDAVEESSEFNKVVEVQFAVDTRMDVFHVGELTVDIAEGALQGPWVVSGKLGRTNGTGVSDVPMWLQISSLTGQLVTTAPFSVSLSGTGYAESMWSHTLTAAELDGLPAGMHTITAKIDPFSNAAFTQESTDNDELSSTLSKFEVPDVFVDANAIASSPSVNSGDSIEWRVSMVNTGDIRVSGRLHYTWEGTTETSPIIYLDSGQDYTWVVELTTAIGAHQAAFEAQWVASSNSWDSNPLNSVATGIVSVEAELRLNWALSTLEVTDSEGSAFTLPMTQGIDYSLTIDLTSTATGSLTYDCVDGDDEIISTLNAEVVNLGDKVTLACDFTAVAPSTVVRLVPSDSTISNTFTRTFTTVLSGEEIDDMNSNSELGTFTLIGFVAVILIAILAISVFLTRESEEEVERDIFEYCPACDGELEGDEDRCPHCSFNLKKARKQFHDCSECGESIPDLLDNCVYCGAEQDVSSYFEKRERKERAAKEIVALPVEIDEDAIVTGTEDFAQTVKEFGFDEEELEFEWDENIVSAEAEVEAAYDRRNADEILREDMTEEELEAYENTVTTTLKSMKDLSESTNDIDAILASKGEIIAHKDDGKDLSASDADIRGRLYEITGEDGIMPGDKVNVGMQLSDSAFAGNEVSETTSDFTVIDDEKPLSKIDDLTPKAEKPARRRGARRKAAEEVKSDVAECGACGADLPVEATECGTCGAKFE